MKSFLAAIVTGLLLASGAAVAQEHSECLTVDNITPSHRSVRPEGTLNVHVRLKTSHCVLDNAFGAGTTTMLFVEQLPGFESTTGRLVYSAFDKQLSSLDAPRAHVVEATVELKAGRVPSGAYDIPASLDYQAIDEQGNVAHQRLGFTIPIMVDDASHPSSPGAGQGFRKALVITGEAVLILLLSPVLILECWFGGNCWTC